MENKAVFVGVGYQPAEKWPLETAVRNVENPALAADAQTACPDQDVDDGFHSSGLATFFATIAFRLDRDVVLPSWDKS